LAGSVKTAGDFFGFSVLDGINCLFIPKAIVLSEFYELFTLLYLVIL